MWYKSFSLWLMLHLGFSVLFQDLDLVWFQDPFQAFELIQTKNKWHRQIDAFLSDDGQRSMRYTPFYANSGFFYLRSCPETIHFAWRITISFDLLHITGSHQNIFTQRLMEALDLGRMRMFSLPIRHFPSGVKYSHDRPFMRAIRDGYEYPYIFHM